MFSPDLKQQLDNLRQTPIETLDDKTILLQFCGLNEGGKEVAQAVKKNMDEYLTFHPNRHDIVIAVHHEKNDPRYYAKLTFYTAELKKLHKLYANGDLEDIFNNRMTIEADSQLSDVQTDTELT